MELSPVPIYMILPHVREAPLDSGATLHTGPWAMCALTGCTSGTMRWLGGPLSLWSFRRHAEQQCATKGFCVCCCSFHFMIEGAGKPCIQIFCSWKAACAIAVATIHTTYRTLLPSHLGPCSAQHCLLDLPSLDARRVVVALKWLQYAAIACKLHLL